MTIRLTFTEKVAAAAAAAAKDAAADAEVKQRLIKIIGLFCKRAP